MSKPITDYAPFFSKRANLKKPSPIRALIGITSLPGMISLGGGLPNPSTFPFKSMKIELNNGEELVIEGSDLNEGLQYSPTPGLPRLNQWLRNLQIRNHSLQPSNTPGKEWDLIISCGSQESLANTVEVLLDDGDSIITETPTYTGTLSILRPLGLNIVGIEVDKNGMIPEKLEKVLSEWKVEINGKFPKVIYLIPSGQNPCGSTMNNERKQELYNICSKYNLIILEDDPYYYLQFDYQNENSNDGASSNDHSSDTNQSQKKLGKSFLSIDVDGRVLRYDSLSKVLSSGTRLGFVTGPKAILEKINFHQQSTTLQASGVSQMIIQSLLTKWGFEQWDKHIDMVQSFYREKRNTFIQLLEKNLKGLIEYNIPSAGMFVWIKLLNIDDSKTLIFEKAIEKKVILVPGIAFETDQSKPSSYVRASFSTASSENMDEALKRLLSLLNDELNNNKINC